MGIVYAAHNMDGQFVEFTKVDEDRRQVFGWAYVAKDTDGNQLIDTQSDFIDDDRELEDPAYSFVKSSRRGHLMHVKADVATMIESVVFTPDKMEKMGIPSGSLPQLGWWVGYEVNDDATWAAVKDGKLKGFSMGGSGFRQKVEI